MLPAEGTLPFIEFDGVRHAWNWLEDSNYRTCQVKQNIEYQTFSVCR